MDRTETGHEEDREGEGCAAARRSRPVFRLETLRWNLEIERAGNQVQVGHQGLVKALRGQGSWEGKSLGQVSMGGA